MKNNVKKSARKNMSLKLKSELRGIIRTSRDEIVGLSKELRNGSIEIKTANAIIRNESLITRQVVVEINLDAK